MNLNITFEHLKVILYPDGRHIITAGHLYNSPVMIANVYNPNIDDAGFFEHLFSKLPDLNSLSYSFLSNLGISEFNEMFSHFYK